MVPGNVLLQRLFFIMIKEEELLLRVQPGGGAQEADLEDISTCGLQLIIFRTREVTPVVWIEERFKYINGVFFHHHFPDPPAQHGKTGAARSLSVRGDQRESLAQANLRRAESKGGSGL